MLNDIAIYVDYKDKITMYKRIVADNGIVNYFATDTQTQRAREFGVTDCILLPLSPEEYAKPKKFKQYYGYKYIFCGATLDTVLAEDAEYGEIPVSQLQMTSEVHRFRYKIIPGEGIKIEKMYDCTFPPRIISTDCPTIQLGVAVLAMTKHIIDEYNSWYIKAKI